MLKPILTAAAAAVFAAMGSAQLNLFHGLDEKATFYRTANDPLATDTVPVDLGAWGLFPGDSITILRVGRYFHDAPSVVSGTEIGTSLNGVFSASDVLLASNLENRVQDAIDAGNDAFTGPTFNGTLPTDISEDFQVSPFGAGGPVGVTVTIPTGATHLFLAAVSSFYGDNTDPNDDFSYRITAARAITVDVKPDSDDDSYNVRTKFVSLAILGASNLDVQLIDLSTVLYRGAGVRTKPNGTYHAEVMDVNGDFTPDLVLHFDLASLGLASGTYTSPVNATLTNGVFLVGLATIRIFP